MSNKTAKDLVKAIGKALREEMESLQKAEAKLSPQMVGLKVVEAVKEQIAIYKKELAKLESKENTTLEKAVSNPNNVVGTNGKTLDTGKLLPSTGKFDVFKTLKANKAKDRSGVIGSTVHAGEGGAQFGLSPQSVAAGKAQAAKTKAKLAEPHKSPVLKDKAKAPKVNVPAEHKDLPATTQKEPEKMPVRDLKLKDGGKPEPKAAAPIESPEKAHPAIPTAMTPEKVNKVVDKDKATKEEANKELNKEFVKQGIVKGKEKTAPEAPKKEESKAPESKKEAPKKEEPKSSDDKQEEKPKRKLHIIDVKDGESEKEAEERTNRENQKISEAKPKRHVKGKVRLPNWEQIGKSEEVYKSTHGLPGNPDSNAEMVDKLKTKKRKTVFSLLKHGSNLYVSKDPEKALKRDKNDKAVLTEGETGKDLSDGGSGELAKKSEKMEKAYLGGRDAGSKMLTTHAMADAAKDAKNAKMPTNQQMKTKMPSPQEHMDRANDLMHWMNPANHFSKMDDLFEKRSKKKGLKKSAPPGFDEETMHKLKREHGEESAFKIAWAAYDKKHGKKPKHKKAEEKLSKEHIGFDKLKNKVKKEGYSEKSAEAIAASVGDKKFGKSGMAKKAAAGKK